MIIDIHGHISAPEGLYAYKATLLASRGAHGKGNPGKFSDEAHEHALHGGAHAEFGPHGHIQQLDDHGTGFQLISPRPFHMMHSEKPAEIVEWFAQACNNAIADQVRLYPTRFAGVAGLPQIAGAPIELCLPELERAVRELGFVGCLFNSDPFENGAEQAPPLGDRYWYPLYEKLCELDVPAMLHGTGSRNRRTSYSLHFINEETIAIHNLVTSNVFKDFPTLKIIIPHGGGAVPYQIGRMRAPTLRRGGMDFLDGLRNLWIDTALYNQDALELLIKIVGADRLMFATECPGTGTAIDPDAGHQMDDVKQYIDRIHWLSEADRARIYTDNARHVFNLKI